ncbi:hypothetical protein P7K49_014876 [Saguinus oedipus]|uniref:Uncharacterized protein n=1 Tax=Saguinus oedipus TaxID=9490 RepID=A0ABQ9V7M0_SAGOE|nr:hypothetical protein P7K49_014876 [Saguinus oedipus]
MTIIIIHASGTDLPKSSNSEAARRLESVPVKWLKEESKRSYDLTAQCPRDRKLTVPQDSGSPVQGPTPPPPETTAELTGASQQPHIVDVPSSPVHPNPVLPALESASVPMKRVEWDHSPEQTLPPNGVPIIFPASDVSIQPPT